MADLKNLCLDWNDVIENDGQEFILLEEGDYKFRVINFERGTYPGGQKLPACNKATITIQVETERGNATVKFDLFLYRTVEWRICSFFRCIGQKRHGEKLVMDWNAVIGSTGKARIKKRQYTNANGEVKTINEVDRFYDFDPMDTVTPIPNGELDF